MSNNLHGQSRSRRTARPYVLAIIALGVLIAIVVGFAQPRETRDSEQAARQVVAPGDPTAVAKPPTASDVPRPDGRGDGTRDMPDGQTPNVADPR